MTTTTAHAAIEAAQLAGYAPSIHNSQPWKWRVGDAGLDLYLDPGRTLRVSDPDGRLAVLSCGAALHHARVALAAQGWRVHVTRLPDPADERHLAHLDLVAPAAVTPRAIRQVQNIRLRHTDRRAVTETPVSREALLEIVAAAEAEGARLHLLPRDRVVELATAVTYAQDVETAEVSWHAELSRWAGGARAAGDGIPDSAIPATPTKTTVPSRDFGRPGTLPSGFAHDKGATFAILYGEQDTPDGWLRAGEALSAAWLAATGLGVALVPLSATSEVPASRSVLSRLLSYLGEPYLVLRLGIADPEQPGPPHTPRLRPEQIIEQRI